ncbi:hypothetical protein [Herbaspirillum robiniae]|uniref:Uncharacterized protein n=1 Tax=Herbaspirillum robiniae TaxID=2014887 RepID=A0ABX2LUF6_9BURK|nr:hypothetical protein [Herbaspirillum robiniae]NUU02167.1 hypothetical protein [Herbaspirillum robiniae]
MPTNTATPTAARRKGTLIARAMRSDITWLAGCVLAIAGALQLAGVAASRYVESSPPAVAPSAGAGIEQAGNELLYRACVREARLKSLPVKPYPQESQSVSFIHEGKRLLRETETQEADVSDMSVDNGCQVKLQRHVRTEPALSAAFTDSVRKVAMHDKARERLAIRVDDARPGADEAACKPQRDMALQSHYMLLSLCMVERRPSGNASKEAPRANKRARRLPST